MPADPRRRLRDVLSEKLGRLWGYDAATQQSTIVPEQLRDHVDAVGADHLPEDVAQRIIDAIDNPDPNLDFEDDESGALPLVARVNQRGLFEDDWSARPTEDKPWPVVLVHGTGATTGHWGKLARDLRAHGWAVFAPAYGNRGTDEMQESATQIGGYIDAVLAVTGAQQVIVIGHSQGGLLVRYWLRAHDCGAKVRHMVSLAAPNHGTTLGGIISPLISGELAAGLVDAFVRVWFGPAGFQQVIDSPIVEAANEGGDLVEGVTYTCIATRSDLTIQPPETCFLHDPDAADDTVHNVWVQDVDPTAVVMHEDMPGDHRVRHLVVAALAAVAAEARPER
ncbi:hypothetical protein B841_00550 [Corynebacterium maris DSM 45190]|uniref:AB hydrolase-1 domain-containing protein n=1 Tax=Corynebacterium maris DSM 45190 TaxID=1224163 RepID=S5TG03_9CORY|nr:triacylglycerol lipase [Corynebacterium maris]AGS33593.1 hypothetical protein B841_00550 [Corynebacterium maris DSM 45190]